MTILRGDGSADLNYTVQVGQQGSGQVICTVDLQGGSASQTRQLPFLGKGRVIQNIIVDCSTI